MIPVHRLFLKIFLWFWFTVWGVLTIVVGSAYFQGPHVLAQPSIWATMAPILATEAVRAYESRGPEAFHRFSQSGVDDSSRQLYLLNGYGEDVLGRSVSDDGARMARIVKRGQLLVLREHIAAYRLVSEQGRPYVLLLYLRAGFAHLPQVILGRGVLFLLALLLLVTLLCLWLAYHIASPMYAIQAAARKVTRGDLSARAPAEVLRRRDELASLAADFNSMVDRIEVLVQTQKQLLASVSHELRSPLARLNVSVALLQEDSGARGRQLLGRMERDLGVIDRLIGQLLTLSRFEAGVSGARREDVDLSELVEEVGADGYFEAQAANKGVKVTITRSARVQEADSYALRSACENIVRNAVRFTSPGTTVEIELAQQLFAGRWYAIIAVRDRGPGVPVPMLRSIFEPFVRVEGQDVQGHDGPADGNGLGLAIAAGAVRLHRGSISARNRDEGGLEIVVRIPLEAQDAGRDDTAQARPASLALS